jgi:hypothetical protein
MKIFIAIIFCLSLYADIKTDMLHLYKNGNFDKACQIGYGHFESKKNDEEFISLYSFSCLHADHIDRLAIPIISLRFSKEARANASYFSIILMQKKLLYHALLDNHDISIYSMPTTEHILSKVFDLYAKLGKHEPKSFYLFEDEKDKKLTYKLYLSKDERATKMIIEEFYNSAALKRHIYW